MSFEGNIDRSRYTGRSFVEEVSDRKEELQFEFPADLLADLYGFYATASEAAKKDMLYTLWQYRIPEMENFMTRFNLPHPTAANIQ